MKQLFALTLTSFALIPVGLAGDTPTVRNTTAFGVVYYDQAKLEDAHLRNERLNIRVVGMLVFEDDVSADMVDRTVANVSVFGRLVASDEVRAVLAR